MLVTGGIGVVGGGLIGGVSAALQGGDADAIMFGIVKGAVVGGVVGLTGGAAAGAVAWGMGATTVVASAETVMAANLLGAVASGALGDVAGQYVGWGFDQGMYGPTQGKSFGEVYNPWQTAGAAAGGV